MRDGSADVSKTISHDKMLHYGVLIDITANNYNLPRSLKGGVQWVFIYRLRSGVNAALL